MMMELNCKEIMLLMVFFSTVTFCVFVHLISFTIIRAFRKRGIEKSRMRFANHLGNFDTSHKLKCISPLPLHIIRKTSQPTPTIRIRSSELILTVASIIAATYMKISVTGNYTDSKAAIMELNILLFVFLGKLFYVSCKEGLLHSNYSNVIQHVISLFLTISLTFVSKILIVVMILIVSDVESINTSLDNLENSFAITIRRILVIVNVLTFLALRLLYPVIFLCTDLINVVQFELNFLEILILTSVIVHYAVITLVGLRKMYKTIAKSWTPETVTEKKSKLKDETKKKFGCDFVV